MTTAAGRMPTIFMPHGGGPWPFVDLSPMISRDECDALSEYLKGVATALPRRPSAMVVVSAHWEEAVPTVMVNPAPPILYDYYGFLRDRTISNGLRLALPRLRPASEPSSKARVFPPPRTLSAVSITARSFR
jgi:hypothetical protein